MYLLLEKEYFQPAMLDYWSAVVYPFYFYLDEHQSAGDEQSLKSEKWSNL